MNRKDRTGFVEAIGWVFEHSPWVAERAWSQRPFRSIDALHDAMMSEVARASADEQLRLLRAHPDLGARAKMSEVSADEQAAAGLDNLTRGELDRLTSLNTAFKEQFGFPFLYAVKSSTKHDILDALEQRVRSTRDAALAEALRQVSRIARFRLEQIFRSDS